MLIKNYDTSHDNDINYNLSEDGDYGWQEMFNLNIHTAGCLACESTESVCACVTETKDRSQTHCTNTVDI